MALDYEFEPFSLDVERLLLYKHGEVVQIGPKALRVLIFLVKNFRRALTKEELFREFWPEHGNHDGNLKAVINQLRKALDDSDPLNPRFIDRRTKGVIRFVGDVRVRITQETEQPTCAPITQKKILWAKILHLRQKGVDEPAYRVNRGRTSFEVYDELMFYSLHLISEELPGWEWSIVSSGDPLITHITHPWQTEPSYFDPLLATAPSSHITPRCTQPSNVYLTVTNMYNALQEGNEDAYAKVEIDVEYLRFVVDFASLPEPRPTFKRKPYCVLQTPRPGGGFDEEQVELVESYPGIFTVARTDLKNGQILRVLWNINWKRIHPKSPNAPKRRTRRI